MVSTPTPPRRPDREARPGSSGDLTLLVVLLVAAGILGWAVLTLLDEVTAWWSTR